ncbi:MAG TPA: lipocalin-like domain-containing protein [Candidatus Acidoferrum sp.]
MKTRRLLWLALLVLLQPAAAQYKTALPGYRYEFPRDHFSHPQYQTEWWYFTGNVTASDGHRFGFELTFFRQGVNREPSDGKTWDIQDVYLAHLALSDIDGGTFYHTERFNRAGPGIAGIDEVKQKIWNGNWDVSWNGSDQQLSAVDSRFNFSLLLQPEKSPVIHGENGVSQKAEGAGRASHYISFTRLNTSGSIEVQRKIYKVSGLTWMDHEFFTHQLETIQIGWDWLSIQLADHSEIMLYQIRRKDGSIDPFSSGTYVDEHGKSTALHSSDFVLTPYGETWKSPSTSATYPIQWKIAIPKLGVELESKTDLKSQEIPGQTKIAPSYWEGAIRLAGHRGAAKLDGVGYLEMTGYDRPLDLGASKEIPSR